MGKKHAIFTVHYDRNGDLRCHRAHYGVTVISPGAIAKYRPFRVQWRLKQRSMIHEGNVVISGLSRLHMSRPAIGHVILAAIARTTGVLSYLKCHYVMPQSHHTPGPVRAVPGLFPGWFEQKSYVHSRGPHGPRTNFASPYGARRVLMHALKAYGPHTGLEIVNSPWTAPAGSVRGPYGQIRRPCGSLANSGCVNSLTCP